MSCTYDGANDFERWSKHTARKPHWCYACRERILPGHRYAYFVSKFDGDVNAVHYCLRCEALLEHLIDQSSSGDEGPDPALDCGHDYEEVHGTEPPPHIAALAFWLPGEPVPEAHG